MRKPFSKKNNMQISFYLCMCGEPKSKHALIQKRLEIKQRTKFLCQLKIADLRGGSGLGKGGYVGGVFREGSEYP